MEKIKTPRTDERFPPGFEDYNPADRDLCEELEIALENLRAANDKALQDALDAMHEAIAILECGDKPAHVTYEEFLSDKVRGAKAVLKSNI